MASGSTIATAYVQILPSTENMKSNLSAAMNDDAESAGEEAGGKAGSKFGTGLKIAAAAALAGLGKIVSEAVEAGSAYEQNVGGIETLFGAGGKSIYQYAQMQGKSVALVRDEYNDLITAQNLMLSNASDAWQTAGLSANDYMETVTGFAASLKQSVEDPVELANAANQAVIDMSDNANKMGTSMESIQNAYQGFAKQNFTMLDNLKLGYGGTKSEMERLLADASALSGIDYDIENLNDVYSAIHIIQDEIGITGTTAKEAESTFSGSLSAVKGAFNNTLASLATGDGLDESLSGLVTSVETFMEGNAIPMVQNIVTSLNPAIVQLLPTLVPTLATSLIATLSQTVPAILESLPNLISQILQAIPGIITQLCTEFLPAVIPAIFEAIIGIIDALIEALPDIFAALEEAIPMITEMVSNAIVENFPAILTGIITLVLMIVEELPTIIQLLVDQIPTIVETVVTVLIQNLPTLIQGIISIVAAIVQSLPQILVSIVSSIGNWIVGLIEGIENCWPGFKDAAKEWIMKMKEGISEKISSVTDKVKEIWTNIKQFFADIPTKMMEIGKNVITGLKDGIVNAVTGLLDAVKTAARNLIDGAKSVLGIHSPSTVFADIGENLMLGMANGISDNTSAVTDAIDDATTAATNGAEADLMISASSNKIRIGADEGIISAVDSLRSQMENLKIYLDGNTLVGGISARMDQAMSNRLVMAQRGGLA